MEAVLLILKKYWKEILALLIIIGLVVAIHIKDNKIETQNQEIIQLNSTLAVTKEQLVSCHGTIESQNKQITDAAADAKSKFDAISGLKTTIDDMKNSQGTIISSLRNQPVPKTCEDARKYLRDNLENLRW